MPGKARKGQGRRVSAIEARKAGNQLAELVRKAERLLLELQARVITSDLIRRAGEVRHLAIAADPLLEEFQAIADFERPFLDRAKELDDEEQKAALDEKRRAALLARGCNLSPADEALSGTCRTVIAAVGFILERQNFFPVEAFPKVHAAISGAVQSLKERLPEPPRLTALWRHVVKFIRKTFSTFWREFVAALAGIAAAGLLAFLYWLLKQAK